MLQQANNNMLNPLPVQPPPFDTRRLGNPWRRIVGAVKTGGLAPFRLLTDLIAPT